MSIKRRWILAVCIMAALLGMCAWVFLHLGDWLVVEDPLMPAHAIVVLSGRLPDRALEAARLYREDVAARVWVSQGLSPADELARMRITFVGEDFYNQKVLMASGVPADAIHVLEMPAANTEEEVDEIAKDCRRDQAHKVVIVTSKPHTRRVKLIWRRRVGDDPQMIVRYVRDDRFDAAHWWRVSADALDVVREWLGIANAWLGFPAPASAPLRMRRSSQSRSVETPPVRSVREPLRDVFLLIAFGSALFYSNRWFTFIDDETLILSAAARPIRATIALFRSGVGQHHHPPLYDLLLHFWLRLTGGAFDWLRVPSVVFFVVGIWILSRAAKRLGGAASATALVVLGALWPYGFHFGRLAAWYSFAFLLVSALTWAYLRFCDRQSPSAWTLVCCLALLLVYTNYFGWAIIGLLGADDWWRHRAEAGTRRRLVVSAAILTVAYAPLWHVFIRELLETTHQHGSWRALVLNTGYNVYVLLVSESLAPWFWRFGIPTTMAVAACFVLTFLTTKGAARRFLIFAAILIVVMAVAGILGTKRLLLVGPWVLLPFAVALGTPDWPKIRRALAVSLLVAGGMGWYGVYIRHYYAAPRFFEPWATIADEAAGNLGQGLTAVIGNNPSFFFYLTYALKVPPSAGSWSFAGMLPDDTRADNVWSAEQWIAAGHPARPKMFWIRGMPGPDVGTPMADAADWLDHNCGDRNFRFEMPDPGYELKQRYFPELGEVQWRVEIHEYDCIQPPAPPAASSGRQ